MKTIIVSSKRWAVFFSLIFSLFLISCSKDDSSGNSESYTTTGNATGNQQNPAVATTGTGTLTGTYNTNTNVWQYTINWQALTSAATAVQLYGPADVGLNGTFITALAISTPGVNGSASGSVTLTDTQEAYLLAGRLYYSVLSTTNITGEIRGQITATAN